MATWAVYMDGELRAQGTFSGHTTPLQTGGAFIIGQEQDSMGGGFQRDQSFCGELSHLNIWGRVLDPEHINKVINTYFTPTHFAHINAQVSNKRTV